MFFINLLKRKTKFNIHKALFPALFLFVLTCGILIHSLQKRGEVEKVDANELCGNGVIDQITVNEGVSQVFNFGTGCSIPNCNEGELAYPVDVDADSSGNIYVLDNHRNMVIKFDSTGNYLSEWGGSGENQLDGPLDIEIDQSDGIYISGLSTLKKYELDGTFIREVDILSITPESNPTLDTFPIDTDSSGNLYLLNKNTDTILKYSSDGAFIRDSSGYSLDSPYAIAVDSEDNILVFQISGTNGVIKLNPLLQFEEQIMGSITWGADPGSFNAPHYLAVDESDTLFITDRFNNRIEIFDNYGNYLETFGSEGFGDQEFFEPLGISIQDSTIFVADSANKRIQVLEQLVTTTWEECDDGNTQDGDGCSSECKLELSPIAEEEEVLDYSALVNDMFLADDGYVYITGEYDDNMVIWKYDPDNSEFIRSMGEVEEEEFFEYSHWEVERSVGMSIIVDSSGYSYVVGQITKSDGESTTTETAVWKIRPNGNQDGSFGNWNGLYTYDSGFSYGSELAYDVTLTDAGSNLLIAGYSQESNWNSLMTLWKLSTSGGELDSSFGDGSCPHGVAGGGEGADMGCITLNYIPDSSLRALGMTVGASGDIFIVGDYGYAGGEGTPKAALWKYSSAGIRDEDFGDGSCSMEGYTEYGCVDLGGGNRSYAYAVSEQSDGKIVVAGSKKVSEGWVTGMTLWRLNASGSYDTSFDSDGMVQFNFSDPGEAEDTSVTDLTILDDGSYLVSGLQTYYDDYFLAAKINSDGTLDEDFGDGSCTYGVGESGAYGCILGDFYSSPVNTRTGFPSSTHYSVSNEKFYYSYATTPGEGAGSSIIFGTYNEGLLSCGDGVLDDWEECDDGNRLDGDGCTSSCTLNPFYEKTVEIGDGDLVVTSMTKDADDYYWITGGIDESENGDLDWHRNMLLIKVDGMGNKVSSFGSGGYIIPSHDHINEISSIYSFGNDIVIDNNGKIIVTGNASTFISGDLHESAAMWRLNTDGTLDITFNGTGLLTHHAAAQWEEDNANSAMLSVQALSDGSYLAAGYTYNVDEEYNNVTVWKVNSNGTLDETFGDGSCINGVGAGEDMGCVINSHSTEGSNDTKGLSLAIRDDGSFVVTGRITKNDGWSDGLDLPWYQDMMLWAYNADGTLDPTFGDGSCPNGVGGEGNEYGCVLFSENSNSMGFHIELDSTDNIFVAGNSQPDAYSNDMPFSLFRFDSTGNLDSSFGTQGIASISPTDYETHWATSMGITPDGKYLLAGRTEEEYVANYHLMIVRFNSDGSLDPEFGDGSCIGGVGAGDAYGCVYSNSSITRYFDSLNYHDLNGLNDVDLFLESGNRYVGISTILETEQSPGE